MAEVSAHIKIEELEKRCEQLRSRRDKIDAELTEIQADLMALQRVASRCLLDSDGPRPGGEDAAEHGELRRAVIESLAAVPFQFNVSHVMDVMQSLYPNRTFDPASVSSCLRRLAIAHEEIVELEKGRGRKKTTYEILMPSEESPA